MLSRWVFVCFALAVAMLPALSGGEASGQGGAGSGRSPAGGPGPEEKSQDLAQVARRVINLTNGFRQEQGRGAVEPQAQLGSAARAFADFMARTDRYGHTADGSTPAERALRHGYEYCLVAENIAYQSSTGGFTDEELARGYVEGWKQSSEHRENMLNPAVTDTGVAAARSERTGTYYAVQMFGLPRSRMLEFRISNRSDVAVRYETGGQTLSLPPQSTRTHRSCQAAEVTFHWPNAQGGETVRARHGDHYAVGRGEAGTFRLEKL